MGHVWVKSEACKNSMIRQALTQHLLFILDSYGIIVQGTDVTTTPVDPFPLLTHMKHEQNEFMHKSFINPFARKFSPLN